MIGVVAEPLDLEIAREFFELFKTPWEPAMPGRTYRVVIDAGRAPVGVDAELVLVYGSHQRETDVSAGVAVRTVKGPTQVELEAERFPLYGDTAVFQTAGACELLSCEGGCASYRERARGRTVWRIGYDLFKETRCLLREGQPRVHAHVPTLELHIAILRRLLIDAEIPFVEVPPRPLGYDFTCCLTHDLDFFGIRRHWADATLAGFVARASIGTLADWASGRRATSEAARNWRAVASLPFVFLGLSEDPWQPLEDYGRAEEGRRSTYFVIPFKGHPGIGPDGTVNRRRAVKYQASEIRDQLQSVTTNGHELAVHGIDAWHDAEAGRREMGQVQDITRQSSVGVRMHWLYFSSASPRNLERAGFAYDSTWGYNDAIGYRAGTSQVFRLAETSDLLELPLSIMDTALLYRDRMNLQRDDALQQCFRIVANLDRFGGTLVLNWHDRSLAPERLWGDTYQALLQRVEHGHRVWFATASEAVDWYKWRRSIRFTSESHCRVTLTAGTCDTNLPGARAVTYRARTTTSSTCELPFRGESLTLDL